MAVKLADTLAPMGAFEVAQAKDISVTIDGATKMLQEAIDNGEIGGGSPVSQEEGNQIQEKDDGIYVAAPNLEGYATKEDLEVLMGEDVDETLDTIKELGEAIKNNKTLIDNIPTSENKAILDKLSESEEGALLFDGNEISGNVKINDKTVSASSVYSSEKVESINTELSEKIESIEPVVNNNFTGDLYYGIDRYSEDEICIGEYLGKPLYRKSFVDTLKSSGSKITHDLNVDEYIRIDGIIHSTNGIHPMNFAIDRGANNNALCAREKYIQYYYFGGEGWCGRTGDKIIITIEYTKTTDEPNSFNPSMITNNMMLNVAPSFDDYSEEEIVVGRWIDGRPIYRKVIFIPTPEKDTDTTYDTSNLNIDSLIYTQGFHNGRDINGPIPGYIYNTNNYGLSLWRNSSTKLFYLRNTRMEKNVVGTKASVVIEYTKTTDEPNSFTPDMIKTIPMNDEIKDSDVAEILSVLE